MRKATQYKNAILSWFFESVLSNTIFTIIITAVISGSIPLLLPFIIHLNINWFFWLLLLCLLAFTYIVYMHFIDEKLAYESNFKKEGLVNWSSNELRGLGIASVIDNALFLQYYDIPYTLNNTFNFDYAFEFKAKVLTDVFSWSISSTINQSNMKSYMFQYSPFNKTLRPHFLYDYNLERNMSIWQTPEMSNSPLRTIHDIELKSKKGWFHIRTEVRLKTNSNAYNNAPPPGNTIFIYNPTNFNKLLDIRIYDMNNFGKEIFYAIYREPPFLFLGSDHIGFRNCGVESALYKDIKVYHI